MDKKKQLNNKRRRITLGKDYPHPSPPLPTPTEMSSQAIYNNAPKNHSRQQSIAVYRIPRLSWRVSSIFYRFLKLLRK